MLWIWNIIFICVIINLSEIYSIQNIRSRYVPYPKPFYVNSQPFENAAQESTRNFRHISHSRSVYFDWENGLREATTQALLREGSRDVNLRKHVFGAPILGKEEKATPFGDIAVLARGQLYITSRGYLFNQDPYQNDCDGCHNEYSRNEIWRPQNSEQLIALWTVRRIRHRPVREDTLPRFEVEFTISPITHQHRIQGQITDEGHFNYAIPGHVFLMKGDSHQNLENNPFLDKQGTLVAQSADGRKYILQNFPGVPAPRPTYNLGQVTRLPHSHYLQSKPPVETTQGTTQLLTDETLTEEEERKIYQMLLDILHKKASTKQPQVFKPQPTPAQSPSSTSTQLSESTLVQLPDGNLVPITELSSPFITKTTPGFVTVRFPDSTTPQQRPQTIHTSSANLPKKPSQPAYTRPTTTETYKPQTPVTRYTQPKTSTQPPKTTFHFFSAAEEHDTPTTSRKPKDQYTSQIPDRHNLLIDTTLAQSQDRRTTLRQSTSTKGTTQFKFPSTNKGVTSQLPTTVFMPSTQIATQQLINKVPHLVTTPMHLSTDTETQFSTARPILTSSRTDYSTAAFTRPLQTESAEFSSVQYSTTIPKRPSTISLTEQSTYHTPTTVFIKPSSEKVTMTSQFTTPTKITSEINTEVSSLETQSSSTTAPPADNLVETTLAVTKVMSTFTNETPGTIFIVSEPAEFSSTAQVNPSTENIDRFKTTTITTESVPSSDESISTLKHIITTIGADGTVSVKTTPIHTTTRTSLSRRPSRKHKTKPTTEKSNFLLDTDLGPSKTPLYKYPSKDYSADDIFGTTSPSATKSSVSKNVSKPYKTSDVELALFGKERYTRNFKNRRLKYLGKSPGANATENIKQSSSFLAPQVTITTTTEAMNDITTVGPPNTSQSVLTSISYKINKRKNRIFKNNKGNIVETTTQPMVTTTEILENIINNNLVNNKQLHNFKNSDDDLDEFASKLLSQAKGIEFLNQTTTSTSTEKTPKYMRRRSYVPRAKKPVRKKKKIVSSKQ